MLLKHLLKLLRITNEVKNIYKQPKIRYLRYNDSQIWSKSLLKTVRGRRTVFLQNPSERALNRDVNLRVDYFK